MTIDIHGEIVLRHLEAFLGQPEQIWRRERDGSVLPFQVFFFKDQPIVGSICLVTFGLSSHQFVGPKGGALKFELIICARAEFDPRALSALLIAVGQHCLAEHSTPGLHGVLPGEGGVLSNPEFEHIYWTFPGQLPEEFEVCSNLSPPVYFFQLLPVSSGERDLILSLGWREFERRLQATQHDLLELDRREDVSRHPAAEKRG